MALKLRDYPRRGEQKCLKIEIWPNDHYQNVDLGLKFPMEGLKPPKNPSRNKTTPKLWKNVQNYYVAIINPDASFAHSAGSTLSRGTDIVGPKATR